MRFGTPSGSRVKTAPFSTVPAALRFRLRRPVGLLGRDGSTPRGESAAGTAGKPALSHGRNVYRRIELAVSRGTVSGGAANLCLHAPALQGGHRMGEFQATLAEGNIELARVGTGS